MSIKVYLSQANQQNPGPLGYLERVGCNAIVQATAKLLSADPRFDVKTAPFGEAIRNTAYENTQAANKWGAQRYIAVHTNASGVSAHPAKGTIVFYRSTDAKSKKMAVSLLLAIAKYSPGSPDPGIAPKDGFIEIRYPKCPPVLIELEGHDWVEGVTWITTKKKTIARQLYRGICRGLDLEPSIDVLDPPISVRIRRSQLAAFKTWLAGLAK